MKDDRRPGLSPEILERYRLTVLPPGDTRDLRLPENVAGFLETEAVATRHPGEVLGAVFVGPNATAMRAPTGRAEALAVDQLNDHGCSPTRCLCPRCLRADYSLRLHS